MWKSGKTASMLAALKDAKFSSVDAPVVVTVEHNLAAQAAADLAAGASASASSSAAAAAAAGDFPAVGTTAPGGEGSAAPGMVREASIGLVDDLRASEFTRVVLDAGAFILGAKLEAFGASCEYYTVEEVVKELRDEKARERYRNFPYPIKFRSIPYVARGCEMRDRGFLCCPGRVLSLCSRVR